MKVRREEVKEGGDLLERLQISYYGSLERIWALVGRSKTLLAATIIILSGFCINGNWLLALVGLRKQYGGQLPILDYMLNYSTYSNVDLKDYKLNGFPYYIASSIISGYMLYFPLCGFIQWYFYIRRKDRPEEWKCQPRRFLTWKDEKHEIIYGTTMLTIASITSGLFSCYLNNGGYSTLYYNVSDHGFFYYMASVPALYLFTDCLLYFPHRIFHLPFLYKRIHKVHHRYKQPTAFSSTAIHPVEFYSYQFCTFLPIYLVPIHYTVFLANILYMFYYGIVDHSGVKMDAIWPWQPSSDFHDNHHQYFHVNFGFNSTIWDNLCGTMRKKDRCYNEKIFYGQGKPLDQVTNEEMLEHFRNTVDDVDQ